MGNSLNRADFLPEYISPKPTEPETVAETSGPLILQITSLPYSAGESGVSVHVDRHVLPNRYRYKETEKRATFVAAMDKGVVNGTTYTAHVQIVNSAGSVLDYKTLDVTGPGSSRIGFFCNIEPLKASSNPYTVRCWFSNPTGNYSVRSNSFYIDPSDAIEPFPSHGVELNLCNYSHTNSHSVPSLAFLPLPYGCVPSGQQFLVTENGSGIPSQTEIAMTWDEAGIPAVAHIPFIAKYDSGKPRTYRIYKTDNPVAGNLTYIDNSSGVVVENGYIKFLVERPFAGVSRLWFDAAGIGNYKEIGRGNGGPQVADGVGQRLNSYQDTYSRVWVEESGSQRVIICATGTYVGGTGNPMCYYKTRITASHGVPIIEFSHGTTFISGEIMSRRINDLCFTIPINTTATVIRSPQFKAGFDGITYSNDVNPEYQGIHQYRHDQARTVGQVLFSIESGGGSVNVENFGRSDGWISYDNDDVRATLISRDIWQKFPKQMGFGPSGLIYHSWPQDGIDTFTWDELTWGQNFFKFWNFHHGTGLNLNLPARMIREAYYGPHVKEVAAVTSPDWYTIEPHRYGLSGDVVSIRPLLFDGATIPTTSPQISAGTAYYCRIMSSGHFRLFASQANAQANSSPITISSFSASPGVSFSEYTYPSEVVGVDGDTVVAASGIDGGGLTIANDFALYLSDPFEEFDATSYNKLYEAKPIAMPTGQWVCDSLVFREIAPKSTRFDEVEQAIENNLIGFFSTERAGEYGQFCYRDGHHTWYSDKGRPSLHRCQFTNHYNLVETLWTLYARGGSSGVLHCARGLTDHYINVDTANINENLMYFFHGKGLIHFAGHRYHFGHFPDPKGVLFNWLIDGNRTAKDVYERWHNTIMNNDYYYHTVNVTRDNSTNISSSIQGFQYTKNPRYLHNVHHLSGLTASFSITDTTASWNPWWPVDYADYTKHDYYNHPTGVIINSVDNIYFTYTATMLAWCAKAYDLTGSEGYLTRFFPAFDLMPKRAAVSSGTYNNFGSGPGPIDNGDMHFGWQFPYLLKRINDLNITRYSATGDYGDYPHGRSRTDLLDPRGLKVYVWKPVDQPMEMNLINHQIFVGDIGAQVINVNRRGDTIELFPRWTTVNTNGTAVQWVSGDYFDTNWVGYCNINNAEYYVVSVADTGHLTLFSSAGVQTNKLFMRYYYAQSGVAGVGNFYGSGIKQWQKPAIAYYASQFTIPADNRTGLYEFNFRGDLVGIHQPITNQIECGVLKNKNYQGWSSPPNDLTHHMAKYFTGYIEPLVSYPFYITVSGLDAGSPTKVKVIDASGNIRVNKSLTGAAGEQWSVVMTMNSGWPAPWYIDVASILGRCYVYAERIDGANTDKELALFGSNLDSVRTIKSKLS
jgi:hypothetical protein